MLALMRCRLGRKRNLPNDEEAGVALVVVVILMFIGALIVSAIAMMVVTTIQGNASNKQNTQAFVTAESWRDTAVSGIAKAIMLGDGTMACSGGYTVPGATPTNGAQVKWAEDASEPDTWSSIWSGATTYSSCPTATSKFVVVRSNGTDAGKASQVDSAYGWSLDPDTRPAGTLAYFDGRFTATKSTYAGDLVIRGTDNYKCNNGAGHEIDGDLWVTNASVEVTGDCYVTGNIYAYGFVSVSNKDLVVGGDIITQTGDIDISGNTVTIGGQLYAGHNIILTKSGTVGHTETNNATCVAAGKPSAPCFIGGTAKAVGTVTSPIPVGWKKGDGTALVGQGGQPAPVFDPTLVAVHDATAWLELDATKNLSADSVTYPNPSTPNVCTSAQLTSILQTPGIRAFIDMSGCVSGTAVTVQPNTTNLVRDAMIYVPPTAGMQLKLTSPINNGNPTLNSGKGPEFVVAHADANIADGIPTCTTGSDSLAVSATIAVRTLIYSACGVNATMALTMQGQLYMGTDGLHLNGGTFTCAPMGWPPSFKNLACGVKGEDGIFDPNRKTQSIHTLTRQTEQ